MKGFQVKIFDELYHRDVRAMVAAIVVKGFQVKIFDELYHPVSSTVQVCVVVKGFQVKIFDELYHPAVIVNDGSDGCERLSGQDL